MKKEIVHVSKKLGIKQVTTEDERWYFFEEENKKTGLPYISYVPSVTWILDYYYKSPYLIKWIADKGLDQSEALKKEAGKKGGVIHNAIDMLFRGEEIKHTDMFLNKMTGEMQEITSEEWHGVMTFNNWYTSGPKIVTLASEITLASKKYGYAGTIDWVGLIDGVLYIVDWKTSKTIATQYHIQISAYKSMLLENIDKLSKELQDIVQEGTEIKLGILQIARYTKVGYKFHEVDDLFPLFLSTRNIWLHETNQGRKVKPLQRDLPLTIKLETSK